MLADFDRWDTDHNGTLDATEIDRAIDDPINKGEPAAALAALKGWIQIEKPAPSITKSWITGLHDAPKASAPPTTPFTDGSKPVVEQHEDVEKNLDVRYRGALRRIRSHTTDLYTHGGPKLDDIKQGRLGDCFMLAPLGAMVNRDPAVVQQMIQTEPTGYKVTFGDGKTVEIAPLTDAELALGGASMGGGLWVRVLEKAFGSRHIPVEALTSSVATDKIHGGSTGAAGTAYSGKKYSGIRLVGDFHKTVSDADLEKMLTAVRTQLPPALAAHHLALAGTLKHAQPKSITQNHGYAVLGFDSAKDTITVWNPHGNRFTPKGPEGFDNGYTIQNGVFTMPLKDFVRTFNRIMIETDTPVVAR
jgi:hypothetical protein